MKDIIFWNLTGDVARIYQKLTGNETVKVKTEAGVKFSITPLPLLSGLEDFSTKGYQIKQGREKVKAPILSEEQMVNWISSLQLV